MSSKSRARILSRLQAASRWDVDRRSKDDRMAARKLDTPEKTDRLKQLMEGMRTEVHEVDNGSWVDALADIVERKRLGSLLYSPETDIGPVLESHFGSPDIPDAQKPELISYNGNIEDFKAHLFGLEASITTSKGAIADAGAILLWPNEKEPRLMSLVPPVHIVVVDAETIHGNLSEAMEKENWHREMPSNALLISGPSKTADIELTLAFGVHGPRELVVLIKK